MGLRTQMLAVGLLTLAVPALGWQSVRQLHASLQQTRVDAQALRVANLRAALAGSADVDTALGVGAAPPAPGDWYAESARWPLFVDGYADDWRELAGETLRFGPPDGSHAASASGAEAGASVAGAPATRAGDASLAVRVARRGGSLFLFVRVRDDDVVHHLPPRLDAEAGENERPDRAQLLANGDALELFVETPAGAREHALISTIAPGPIEVVHAADAPADGRPHRVRAGQPLGRWRAEWIGDANGYQVEIELPLPPAGARVGLAAIDVARAGGARDAWVGSMSPRAMRAGEAGGGTLYHQSAAARARLHAWVTAGTRARLFDAGGRLLADVDALYAPLPDGEAPPPGIGSGLVDAVLRALFAWLAAGDLPLFPETDKRRQPLHLPPARLAAIAPDAPTTRYVTVDNDRVLGSLVALGADDGGDGGGAPRGYLLYESNEEHAAAYTSSRLARLFALLLLASLAVGALLLAWATRLSLRIRRLSREAARAVDADGRVARDGDALALGEGGARDEIGELSRNLASLLARSSAYTRYLETLSTRLSHELGTPLSVVRTSIENLDTARLDAESRALVARASGGAERLGGIVRALVESARLEQAVQHATFAPLDVGAWLGEARAQYAQVYPDHRFRVLDTFAALESARDPGGGEGATRVGSSLAARPPASAALLQQALDKLVDNAASFATSPDIALVATLEPLPGKRLPARTDGAPDRLTLAVVNTGPPLGLDAARARDAATPLRRGSSRRPGGRTTAVRAGLLVAAGRGRRRRRTARRARPLPRAARRRGAWRRGVRVRPLGPRRGWGGRPRRRGQGPHRRCGPGRAGRRRSGRRRPAAAARQGREIGRSRDAPSHARRIGAEPRRGLAGRRGFAPTSPSCRGTCRGR